MSVYPGLFGFGVVYLPDEDERARRPAPGSGGVHVDRRPVRRGTRR
jgi:hypothetical protein